MNPGSSADYRESIQQCSMVSSRWMRKTQHNRSLHIEQLTNIYLEALRINMPSSFLAFLETIEGDQTTYNLNKKGQDISSMIEQNDTIKQFYRNDIRSGRRTTKTYCDEVLAGLARNLQHDRSVHKQKLQNILDECLKLSGNESTGFSRMLECIIKDNDDLDMVNTMDEAEKCYELNVDPIFLAPLVV